MDKYDKDTVGKGPDEAARHPVDILKVPTDSMTVGELVHCVAALRLSYGDVRRRLEREAAVSAHRIAQLEYELAGRKLASASERLEASGPR